MCHLYPYKIAVLSEGTNFYETWVLDNSYLWFKVQHPSTHDSTQITAGGPVEGPVPHAPSGKYICSYLYQNKVLHSI